MTYLQITGRSLFVAATLGLLGACGSTSTAPRLDSSFGLAVDTLRLQQTINPRAGESLDPATGIDGETGRVIIDAYRGSFGVVAPASSDTRSTTSLGGGSK